MELKDLRLYQYLVKNDTKLAGQVESVYNATKETIDAIAGCYNNYTMHNTGHSLRVAGYIGDLACGIDGDFDKNIENFNAFEITLMLLSALLHDIGMFIRPEDREKIKRNEIAYTNSLTFSGVMDVVGNNEDEAIKEIVRITHAQRIKEYVDYQFGDTTIATILKLEDKYGYSDDIIDICVGHGEDYEYLKKLRTRCTKGKYTYNPQFIAVLLRIADYLDLDSQRTPVLWYKMMRIEGFSKDEWEKHFVVHNEQKLKKYVGNELQIFFEGKSSNAKIHRKYLAYVDAIRAELERADALLNHKDTEEKYLFHITPKVDDCVITEGFRYSDLRLSLDYSSITDLLMGNNIYGNKQLGLRELIQNSLDACGLMREIQEKVGDDDTYAPQISILISKNKGYIKIKDNGMGMTLDVIKKHFLNVGKSYYKSNEFKYESYVYKPIGQFGIGFLACFLLSDNVTVKTKYYNSNEIHQIELEKNSEYVVTNTEETGSFSGTEITLDYDKFFEVFSDMENLLKFVKAYFYTDIPLVVKNVDERKEILRYATDCKELLGRVAPELPGVKYEYIDCSQYSSKVEGMIRAKRIQKRTGLSVEKVKSSITYLFDKETKKFTQITDSKKISTGYYRIVKYANLNQDMYEEIRMGRKTAKTRRNAILAASTSMYLLFKEEAMLTYAPKEKKRLQAVVDDIFLEDAATNSNIPYYDELVDEFEYFEPVFVTDGKYISLQECYIIGRNAYYVERTGRNFTFYNKGILVRDYHGILCNIPAALDVSAVINYLENGIRLDVSRNNIISGSARLQKELSIVFLKYLRELEKDPERAAMMDVMIENT